MFKRGDKVKRIKDFKQSTYFFIPNKVYTVRECTEDGIGFMEFKEGGWDPEKFELVKEKLKSHLPSFL